ncbi:MAG: TolC family protein [Bacteroidia bacterium]|nr:TolC family protein [Bacteroidia bacterium]
MKRILTSLVLVFFASALFAQSPLTLEEAVDTALKNNFDIRISRNASGIAQANNTAGNAGMLPTVSLNGSVAAGLNAQHQESSNGTVTNSTPSTMSGNAGIELSWTLYDGGKMFVTRQKLREASQLGEFQFRETVQQKLYELVAAYYDLIRLKQQLRSVEQTIRYNQERVTIAQTGFNAGTLSKLDLLQAKIDLNEVLETAISQEFAIREGKRALNALLARDTETPVELRDSIPNGFQPDKDALFSKLNSTNASVLSFQKQLEINRLALKETKSNYLPRFDFSAGYNVAQSTNSTSSVRLNRNLGPEIGGNLSIPIYQAGESKRLQKVAELNLQSAESDLEKVRLQMIFALQNTLNDFDNQKALLKIEEQNNLLAKEYLEISIQRLRLGQTNSLEVHLAQEKFMNSNTRLINYRFNLKLAETKLRQLVAAL